MSIKTYNDCCEKKTTQRPGRPLDKTRDSAILKSALELVATLGYDAVTMDAIAQKAGAGKATLYRRWKSKPYLISDALSFITPCEQKVQHERCTDNLREYLCELLGTYFGVGDEIRQKVLLSISTSLNKDRELAEAVKLDCVAKPCCALSGAIECTLGDSFDQDKLDLIISTAPSIIFYQLIITRKCIDQIFINQVVDNILIPLLEINSPQK